jgi:hypothetical protein
MFSFLGLMWSHAELHDPHPYVYCRTKEFFGKKEDVYFQ